MKKSLRFASAALALTLAAGCAMPAFAAGKSSFSKSETVYAVMNGDGSIKSTTVSEHLYSASGLANVTDKTTLTDIQNTESDAEFTQNGEELVWNTNDTDVYYKGNTDKALPIDVKVTYALDGQEAALEDIIGKSGHLSRRDAGLGQRDARAEPDQAVLKGRGLFHSTKSPFSANMWFIGPEPWPRSSIAASAPEMYAFARSTDVSRS